MAETYIDDILALKADLEERVAKKDESSILSSLISVAQALMRRGRSSEAYEYLVRAADFAFSARSLDNRERLDALSFIVDLIAEIDDEEIRARTMNSAIDISRRIIALAMKNFPDDRELVLGTMYQCADLLGMALCLGEAIEMTEHVIEMTAELYGQRSCLLSEVKLTQGRNYLLRGNWKRALAELGESLDIALESDESSPSLLADIYLFISNAHLVGGNEIAALRNIESAYDQIEEYEWDDSVRVDILLNIADVFRQLGLTGRARSALIEVIEIEEELDFGKAQIEKHRRLLLEIER